jgi:hypothetical protein
MLITNLRMLTGYAHLVKKVGNRAQQLLPSAMRNAICEHFLPCFSRHGFEPLRLSFESR